MSDVLDKAVEALNDKIGPIDFDESIKFEILGVGAIRIDSDGVAISGEEADCTLIADQEVFEDLLRGDLNPTMAYMSGKLRLEGSMSTAMKFAGALS